MEYKIYGNNLQVMRDGQLLPFPFTAALFQFDMVVTLSGSVPKWDGAGKMICFDLDPGSEATLELGDKRYILTEIEEERTG